MLKANLIPTPLMEPSERPAIEITRQPAAGRFRMALLVRCMVSYFAGLLWMRLRGRYSGHEAGRRLRERFEEMGMLWIKVGQLLSLRTDIFSAAFCRELSRLQYRTVGFEPAVAVSLIETQLGTPLDAVFSEFQLAPMAAASIAQVHRARLRRPDVAVVVKVRRPGVDQAFRQDMALIRALVGFLRLIRFHPHLRLDEGLWELGKIMEEELDYRYEGSNITRMRRNMKGTRAYAPKAFTDLSTDRVLVMELIDGVLMSDVIAMTSEDPGRLARWQIENRVVPRRVGRRLYFLLLRQVLRDNLFHGDLHPGNIMILRGGRIALIDFGTIGTLDREFISLYVDSLRALAARDYGRAADLTLRMCSPLPPIDLDDVKRRMVRAYRTWETRTFLPSAGYHEKSLSSAENDANRVLFENRISSNWALLRMSRTWATLDSTLAHLMPDVNYIKLLRRYFRQEARQDEGLCAGWAPPVPPSAVAAERTESWPGISFQQSPSKGDELVASGLRGISLALLAAQLVLLLAYLYQHHPVWTDWLRRLRLEGVVGLVPSMRPWTALLLLATLFFVRRSVVRLRRRFAQKNPPGFPGRC